MPFKRILLPLFSLLVIAVTAVSATAATYNPFTQFSIASNPNGVWSYGYGSVGSGAITLYTQSSAQGSTEEWALNGIPYVSNFNGAFSTGLVPQGDLAMHPGNADNQSTILVFTAPSAGTYSLSGLFERDDQTINGGNGVQVSICLDTANCSLFSQFVSPSAYLNNAAFNLSETLSGGETLDFEVARTGGSYNYDTTGLQLNITSNATPSPTPEPSSFVLLGTGVAALFGAAKRRMRKLAV